MRKYDVRRMIPESSRVSLLLRVSLEITGLLLAAVFLGYLMQRLHHANLSILFLLVVLIIAARHGLWPSVVTSALGFLAFNFFFTAPYATLRVSEEGDIATLVFFLAIAILGGNLASRLRSAIRRRDQALERVSNLYDFSHAIGGAATRPEILQTLANHLSATVGVPAAIRNPDDGLPMLLAASRSPHAPTGDELASLRRKTNESEAPRGDCDWSMMPIGLGPGGRAIVALRIPWLSEEQRDLVSALCGQAEVALDRVRLAEDLAISRRDAERARLRSALLTSVSHDLRTPLSSIIGATSTVQELGDGLTPANRTELLDTVMDEARRLNGYIQNLLDMTRIEHGELRVLREWEDPSDLISAAIRRAGNSWRDASISSDIAPGTGMVRVHGELFVQALHNVIDNALRYSPDGAPVEVACRTSGDSLIVEVSDTGRGIDADQRERIFDMFDRAEAGDSHSGGTGLGLSITRGILEAHGGRAYAEAGPDGTGTRIVLELPHAIDSSADVREPDQ